MQKLMIIFFIALGFGCRKDEEPKTYTAITGYWFVRTPDNATNITFSIGIDSNNEYIIETASVNHNGSDYTSQPIDARLIVISPTEIESITFRALDDFIIRLLEISVNNDFTELEIANSIFTIDGDIREFSIIKANR